MSCWCTVRCTLPYPPLWSTDFDRNILTWSATTVLYWCWYRASTPLPNLQDLSANLHGSKIFSKLDLVKGYHQVPVNKDDIPKTAIITPFGLFEYIYMPFGLKNAAQTFQRLMDSLLRHFPFVFVFLDDLLIFSKNREEHLAHLKQVLEILSENTFPVKSNVLICNGPLQISRKSNTLL